MKKQFYIVSLLCLFISIIQAQKSANFTKIKLNTGLNNFSFTTNGENYIEANRNETDEYIGIKLFRVSDNSMIKKFGSGIYKSENYTTSPLVFFSEDRNQIFAIDADGKSGKRRIDLYNSKSYLKEGTISIVDKNGNPPDGHYEMSVLHKNKIAICYQGGNFIVDIKRNKCESYFNFDLLFKDDVGFGGYEVKDISFCSDPNLFLIAFGSKQPLKLITYSLSTNKVINAINFPQCTSNTIKIAVHPNKSEVICPCYSDEITVLNYLTGKLVKKLTFNIDKTKFSDSVISDIAISPNGKYVVGNGMSGNSIVIDYETNSFLNSYDLDNERGLDIYFLNENKIIINGQKNFVYVSSFELGKIKNNDSDVVQTKTKLAIREFDSSNNYLNGAIPNKTHENSSNKNIFNSNASNCEDKIIKSSETPSYKEYKMFAIDKNDIAKEICNDSKVSVNEYVKSNGQISGYSVYYYSSTKKRIKDEIFDEKGRLMQQYLYEYYPNDKAKYMFFLNYLGEITLLRALGTDGMRDANFKSPYPNSKEKAIYRYNHPDKMKFTDMCQDCRGTGLGNNNLHRCYICNGAGKITHAIIKY